MGSILGSHSLGKPSGFKVLNAALRMAPRHLDAVNPFSEATLAWPWIVPLK